jgi:DNA-binding NtrC family response regulator
MADDKLKVLSIATDAELLWLRHAVLQSAGFNVVSTQTENEALARIHRGECQAVLLGHSLSSDARRRLAQATRTCCPLARIIEIANQKLEKPEFADVFVYGVDGPEALIEALRGGPRS